MARKTLLYNVESTVGKFGANRPDDVLLVRFFLRRISAAPDVNGPYSDLPLVSTFDTTLGEVVLWFQKKVAQAGHAISVDGKVDPSPHGQGMYTIRHLNQTYRKRYPRHMHSIENDPMYPPVLNQPLAVAYT